MSYIKYVYIALVLAAIVAGIAFVYPKILIKSPDNNQNSSTTENSNSTTTVETANIIVYTPKANDEISNVIHLTGKARVFENQLNARILSGNKKITEVSVYASSTDVGLYGDFSKDISLPNTISGDLNLEVFDYSPKDGSEMDKVVIPLKTSLANVQTMIVNAYFGNSDLDPQVSCNKVFSVERVVLKSQSVAKTALGELLNGPTDDEKSFGYFTAINPGVKINSITISNGTAKADFDETLEKRVGGSCKVVQIRSQITETLKQFSSVKNVIISINGRTEDILQP